MAISSPLLEASIDGAHGVLLSIQGGSDLGLFEINEAAQLVANSAAPDANIIFGAVIDDALGDEVRVTVIAAGFDESQISSRTRSPRSGTFSASPASPDGLAASSGWRTFSFPDRTEPAPGGPAQVPDQVASPAAAPTPAAAEPRPASEVTAARPEQEAARIDSVPSPRGSDGPSPPEPPSPAPLATPSAAAPPDRTASRAEDAAATRVPDSSTRRRSVVFEEDDDLDVPDFLK
jgi:cell division protein FtsZ